MPRQKPHQSDVPARDEVRILRQPGAARTLIGYDADGEPRMTVTVSASDVTASLERFIKRWVRERYKRTQRERD